MKNTFKAFAFLIVFFSSALLAQDLKIAAAANLTRALKALVKEFQKEHPKDAVKISFNSSGKLYAQIAQNAPFDLFISADMIRPKKLYDEKITPFKEEVYAKGVLVLWSENLKIHSLEILKDPKIKYIAMANPKLAPYGKASMEVLDHLKLASSLKSKIIYGTSISQAHQFVATKNAQIGFGALSLMDKKDKNLSYFIIDKAIYNPIEQALIITKNGANNPLAKVFKDFLFSPKARAIFKEYGYIVD
ncbi:molybdate ABC transporter substrate-binding protein [Helicobacter pylori]|uniref:molybdate ABC transporter substrate-binding protein n=1 Tax=Helicobacter pylori TaxID=210 RepID=UPI001129AC08|nr:molybdate ABC transporter substrate-binding protein [Helicobacter pylori]TPH45788.1 molybdate ABC transporter substrate-binding protein [Helicobacter pylori]TPH49073.1 molybdate ABC transporter substrate-binding protein [Helicobacter pylori]